MEARRRSGRGGGSRRRTLRASHNAAAVGGNIDASNRLVVALELILELKGVADLAVQLDRGVARHRQDAVVRRERVVGDWVVEQVVHLGSSHLEAQG